MEGMDDKPHSDSDAYDEDEVNESSDDETTNDADQTIGMYMDKNSFNSTFEFSRRINST